MQRTTQPHLVDRCLDGIDQKSDSLCHETADCPRPTDLARSVVLLDDPPALEVQRFRWP